jgi:cytochrome c553
VLQIRNASQASIEAGPVVALPAIESCGPDGLAVTASGRVLAWCSFARNVVRIEFPEPSSERGASASFTLGPSLIASALTAKQHDGLVLFHATNAAVSDSANLECASCHPDNRADGLSWRIEKHELQTPLLGGRVVGTHPFKWDGGDATLRDSLRSTMKRLGGSGLSRRDIDALAAYLEALPAVRTPTRDPVQVARGRKVFDSEGCRSCHDGPAYTDQQRHKLVGTLRESDTPSLISVAASAPYFHDGSAATLEALLRDRGAVHGMADTARLTEPQIADLAAFLDTL